MTTKIEQVRGLLLAGTVERLPEHGLLDVAENGSESVATGIAEQGRGLIARNQFAPERHDCLAGLLMIEHAGGWPRAGRLRQSILVVFQKQAPRIGVACNELEHGLPRGVHRGPVPEGPGQQIEGFPRFPQAVLGKAALVQGVAAHQMIAYGAGSPLAKTHRPP